MRYNTGGNSSNIKKISVYTLYTVSVLICISGVLFGIYSWVNNISFKIINTNVSGIIFGLAVSYLGVRYFLSVSKLKEELYKDASVFSWSNFRKKKAAIK
jgi:hypothetical protein